MDIAMVLSNFKQLICVLLSISHVIWALITRHKYHKQQPNYVWYISLRT